jgi:hypothetical protein
MYGVRADLLAAFLGVSEDVARQLHARRRRGLWQRRGWLVVFRPRR